MPVSEATQTVPSGASATSSTATPNRVLLSALSERAAGQPASVAVAGVVLLCVAVAGAALEVTAAPVLAELVAEVALGELVVRDPPVDGFDEDPEHPASTPALNARRSANRWRRRTWCPTGGP